MRRPGGSGGDCYQSGRDGEFFRAGPGLSCAVARELDFPLLQGELTGVLESQNVKLAGTLEKYIGPF